MDGALDSTNGGWGAVFDEIKAKEGLTTDAQLAATIGVTKGFICAVRKNRKGISNALGHKLYLRLGRRVCEEDIGLFMSARVQQIKEFQRPDPRTRAAVFARASGTCELCKSPAPFLGPSGQPYLELHRICPSELGGGNTVFNLVALCPNCHKKMEIVADANDVSILKKCAASAKKRNNLAIRKS